MFDPVERTHVCPLVRTLQGGVDGRTPRGVPLSDRSVYADNANHGAQTSWFGAAAGPVSPDVAGPATRPHRPLSGLLAWLLFASLHPGDDLSLRGFNQQGSHPRYQWVCGTVGAKRSAGNSPCGRTIPSIGRLYEYATIHASTIL